MIAGLFGSGFLPYEVDRESDSLVPDLAGMTAQALRVLEDSGSGFFLMVESGLIDQAAHSNERRQDGWRSRGPGSGGFSSTGLG
jgi:alkaline phosphatase